jgi:hypothetical protein
MNNTITQSELKYKEPTHCPYCGKECKKPDQMNPEHLRCPEHGDILVESYC